MASIALTKAQQDGMIRVRQQEQLRRALGTAAETLGWGVIPGGRSDVVTAATKDVVELAKAGVRSLERDAADEMVSKKSEMSQLKKIAKAIERLAADSDSSYPADIEYSHTARDGGRDLITKVVLVSVADADEAAAAARAIVKRLDAWEKLRDQMIQELKQRQRRVADLKPGLTTFAESSQGLVREVLATLY